MTLSTTKAALIAAVAGLFLSAAPVAANAASVPNEPPNWTPSGLGAMACGDSNVVNGPGGTSVKKSIHLRTGPNASCPSSSGYALSVNTRLGGWCYRYNESGNKWYYVSVGGESPYGWIYSGNVTSDQSTITTPCR